MRIPQASVVLPVIALLAGSSAAEQQATAQVAIETAQPAAEAITLELIMADPDWIGNAPEDPYWSDDGSAVYFEQKRVGEQLSDLIRLDLASGETMVVDDAERGGVDVAEGRLSPDRGRKVYARRGDLYVKDLETGAVSQLTRTAAAESDASFTADGGSVIFVRDEAVFVRDLVTGLESQPADVRLAKDPDAEKPDDDFLARQQLRLFDVLRDRKADREAERAAERAEQAADPTRPPLPFYLGEDLEIHQRAVSPAGDALLLVVADQSADPGPKDQMADWVTESGYVKVHEVRPKVGTGNGRGERLIYLDLAEHARLDLDLAVLPGISDHPLAELEAAAEAAKAEREKAAKAEREKAEGASGGTENPRPESSEDDDGESADGDEPEKPEPRPVRFELPIAWSPDGREVVVQAHSIDNKDRWLALVDREAKALSPIHRLSHEGWINWSFNELGWLSDSRRLYYLSEETGYSQLYLYSLDTSEARRLTDGDSVVSNVVPGPEERYLYYTANPGHPGIYHTYRVEIESGRIERMTDLGGRTASVPSPDGRWLLITHSSIVGPPELYVQEARPGAVPRRITHTASEEFTSLPWVEPEIVTVPSSHHSRPVYSRFYPAADGSQGGPAVVFIHGAGYLQNAHQGWSVYFREFMFHTFLSQRGYAVLDMDYRGSAGYGADWRTAIYRQMGTPELEDLEDGVAWLVAEHGVDPRRVGVYGGSYGGFLTLMALFKQPDLFAAGAALRPVTDWAHYNHPYTSNILNTPEVDPEAYRRSSPIELAGGLAKPLLICAPMQDDNVFFQDTVRLAQRLIELEKEDWEVAIFPVEPHGFREPASWLNEYRRIYKLFKDHLGP